MSNHISNHVYDVHVTYASFNFLFTQLIMHKGFSFFASGTNGSNKCYKCSNEEIEHYDLDYENMKILIQSKFGSKFNVFCNSVDNNTKLKEFRKFEISQASKDANFHYKRSFLRNPNPVYLIRLLNNVKNSLTPQQKEKEYAQIMQLNHSFIVECNNLKKDPPQYLDQYLSQQQSKKRKNDDDNELNKKRKIKK